MLREEKLDSQNEQRLKSAIAFQQNDQIDQAQLQYQIILRCYPNHTMVKHLLGITFAQTDQLEQALTLFKQCIDTQPQNPHYHASLANALRKLNRLAEAEQSFKNALTLNPQLLSAHNNLALIYFNQSPEKAKFHFEQALAVDPDHIDANYNLGLLLCASNSHRAKDFFSCVLRNAPRHVGALFQLAQLYHYEKAYLKASPLYEKVLCIQPNDPECLNKLGLIAMAQDNIEQGLDYLKNALSIKPTIEAIHHNLACLYLHKREYKLALSHWLQHLKQNQDLDTYYNIGVCYLYLGRYQDCLDHLFHVIHKDPKHYNALINLGAAFLQKNQPELACTYYQRAQAIQETPAITHILSALMQKATPSDTPGDYISALFDNYAHHYDQHLCDILQYQLPKRLEELLPAALNLKLNQAYGLDLGCGTGLSAHAIKPYCHTLVGIDLSQNMLDQAKKKSLYDRLICADILSCQDYTMQQVDLVLTADTLPYFGDLNAVFECISKQLSSSGYWILSIETTYENDFLLQKSARFAHHPDYIQRCAQKHQLKTIHQENIQLRTQQNSFVVGMVYIFQNTINDHAL